MPRILIVTGEASGDLHGANLALALRGLRSEVQIMGVGGPKMTAAGVQLVQGIERLDAIGIVGLGQIGVVLRKYRALRQLIRREAVDAVVFVDNPEMNLRLAKIARKAGRRVVYYISPQIWAWRAWRINLIKRVVDRMIVILPFEEALYRGAGVPCDFVGHPLLDAVAPTYDREELRKRFGIDPGTPVLGLLPGSREQEVRSLLPLMVLAIKQLAPRYPGLRLLVAQADSIPDGRIENLAANSGLAIQIVKDQPSEVMAASDVLIVASGTATLQAAVVGTPMVIVYKLPWLTYWIGRLLVRVHSIGLVNLVAGRRVAPELLQQEATPARVAEEAVRLLGSDAAASEMRAAFRAVRGALGSPGASRRAAEVVLKECRT